MNSFRCFAVYQLKQQLGEFILEHKRGCKKTFLQQRNELEGQIEKHYNIQTEKPVEFIYNCWIGIKKEVDNNTIYCLLLLHKTPDKDIFLDKLEKLFEIFIKNLKNLKDIQNIDRDQLEYQIKLMEQKYEIRGTPDGYATEEDQDEIDRNNKILQKQQQQVQQQQQQQQVQQQQKQQQQYQQQQYQQQQQQYQQQQQKQQQQQQNFQSPEKNSQQRYCNVSKSPSSTNKVREQNYQPIKLVIDNRKQSQPRVNNMDKLDYHLKFDILNSQQNIIGDGQINKEDKLINNQPMGKRRQKEKFRSSEVEIQMKESNKQKQADALIRNSIMGALASSTLALVL